MFAAIAINRISESRRLRSPVVAAWLIMCLVLTATWYFGLELNRDPDDIVKALELRAVLLGGDLFHRYLPFVAQPEAFSTHWPLLVDLPYVLVAAPFSYLIGIDAALNLAMFAVPLVLLLPTIFLLDRIGAVLGFEHPAALLAASIFVGFWALAEFQPYENRLPQSTDHLAACVGRPHTETKSAVRILEWCNDRTRHFDRPGDGHDVRRHFGDLRHRIHCRR